MLIRHCGGTSVPERDAVELGDTLQEGRTVGPCGAVQGPDLDGLTSRGKLVDADTTAVSKLDQGLGGDATSSRHVEPEVPRPTHRGPLVATRVLILDAPVGAAITGASTPTEPDLAFA